MVHRLSADFEVGAHCWCGGFWYTAATRITGRSTMLNAKFFEEMSSKLNEAVANSPAKDFEKNARALLAQGFSKLDLVTREEYEVLAQRVDKLEARLLE